MWIIKKWIEEHKLWLANPWNRLSHQEEDIHHHIYTYILMRLGEARIMTKHVVKYLGVTLYYKLTYWEQKRRTADEVMSTRKGRRASQHSASSSISRNLVPKAQGYWANRIRKTALSRRSTALRIKNEEHWARTLLVCIDEKRIKEANFQFCWSAKGSPGVLLITCYKWARLQIRYTFRFLHIKVHVT